MNPYKNRPSDTPEHIRDMQIAIVLQKSPLDRLKMCCEMSDFSFEMTRRLIRERQPKITDAELKFEFVKATYADCYNEEELNRIKEFFLAAATLPRSS